MEVRTWQDVYLPTGEMVSWLCCTRAKVPIQSAATTGRSHCFPFVEMFSPMFYRSVYNHSSTWLVVQNSLVSLAAFRQWTPYWPCSCYPMYIENLTVLWMWHSSTSFFRRPASSVEGSAPPRHSVRSHYFSSGFRVRLVRFSLFVFRQHPVWDTAVFLHQSFSASLCHMSVKPESSRLWSFQLHDICWWHGSLRQLSIWSWSCLLTIAALGLRVSCPKTKLQNLCACTQLPAIIVDRNTVDSMDSFISLGSVLPSDHYCRPDIIRCIGHTPSMISSLHHIWKNRCLSVTTKTCIYHALVQSVL